jgi:phage FluMu protein Com
VNIGIRCVWCSKLALEWPLTPGGLCPTCKALTVGSLHPK